MLSKFLIIIKRTKDGGKSHYNQYYWTIPWFKGLQFYGGTLSWFDQGIGFYYKGDEVTWIWPWKRTRGKWLSLLASGTGECGDAIFTSLEELDNFWEQFFNTVSIKE